ncbi:MAG: SDR family oxidoreductase [Eudoraea sp.]|nr:SDR family oxidoreductase [Eudoraea sp.]
MPDLTNRVAVITGGGGVLGKEMAMALARNGAKVALLGRSQDTLDAAVNEIRGEGFVAIGISCDVLKKDNLIKANDRIVKEWGTCDILINNAGGNHPGGTTSKEYLFEEQLADDSIKSFLDLDAEGLAHTFDLNLMGTILTSQVFSKGMVGKDNATIINISSISAYLPLTQIPAYSAAKAAVSNFTQWLSVHFSKVGIRVNAIAPGFFVTNQNLRLLTNEDGSPTERGARILSQTPMNRFGKPEDLTTTLLYLCDSNSGFITGAIIPVDGGFSAYSGV